MKNIGESIREYYMQHKWLQHVCCIVLIVGILTIVIPFVLSAGYTYLCEDDFSFEGGARDAAERYGEIKGAFKAAHGFYMSWQGTYFSNFIWHIVRPYIRWGMPGFHAVMIVGILVFIWALLSTVKVLCKQKTYSLAMAVLVLATVFGVTDGTALKEVLFWYTGAVNYMWVLSSSLFTVVLTAKIKEEQDRSKQWRLAVVSVITALIGSGGTLMITAAHCGWLLLILILSYDEILEKKLVVVPFLAAFIGALWNACAPGNFARSAVTLEGESYGVLDAIGDTFVCWKEHMMKLGELPLFLLILGAIFVITVVSGNKLFTKRINHIKMLFALIGVAAIQYLTAFPVVLGYHGSLYNQRTSSTFDLIIRLTLILLIVCLAQWSAEHIKVIYKVLPVIMAVLVIFGAGSWTGIKEDIKGGYAYNLTKELYNGTIRDVYKVREATLSQLDSAADGEDVVIFANAIPPNETMYGMGLLEDSNAFVNTSAAGMFKLNSITVIYK